jgi:ribokinase
VRHAGCEVTAARAPSPGVVVVGDVSHDTTYTVDRLPAADDKVTARLVRSGQGGMAANVAAAIAAVGGMARLVSVVGSDAEGREALEALRREGVDTSFVRVRADATTFRCLVFLEPSGEKALVRLPGSTYQPERSDLRDEALKGMRHLHTTLGDPDLALHALALARRAGLTTSLDLEEEDLVRDGALLHDALTRVDTLFVNRRAERALRERFGGTLVWPDVVIVTLGASGCLMRVEGVETRLDGHDVEVLDTTGAGDAFAGTYLRFSLRDWDRVRALEAANAAAALATTGYGARPALLTERALRNLSRGVADEGLLS